jgi:serine/threonine protein kinase
MNADPPPDPDDRFADWLAAYDDAVAAGQDPDLEPGPTPPEDLAAELAGARECLDFLEEVWPRRQPGLDGWETTVVAAVASGPGVPGPLPRALGRFQIVRELGRGGCGIVFLARDPRLGREVALKVPHLEAVLAPDLRQRFLREAQVTAGLDHPHIVPVYEAGEEGPFCFIASAYCPGQTLGEWLRQRAELVPGREAAALAATLAEAVQHAHDRGVLHRDLKPANVLLSFRREPQGYSSPLSPAGRGEEVAPTVGARLSEAIPRIADFGLAKLLDGDPGATPPGDATQSGAILGTPNYMAPEQALGRNKDVGPAADVYGLGAILYEMLSGRPPFQAETVLDTLEQVRSREPVPPSRLRPRIPPDLETICLKCLRKEAQRRYASARELAEDLGRFLAGEPIRARPVSRRERIRRWVRRRPAVAALLGATGLLTLLLLLGGWWYGVRLRSERDRAEKHFQMALQAVDQMLTEVADEQLVHLPHMEEKRRALLEKALGFYRRLLQGKSTDPAMRAKTALAYQRVADIQRLLGRHAEARAAYGRAIALLGSLAEDYPAVPEYRQHLAGSHNFLGEVLRTTAHPRQARQAYEHAREIQKRLAAEFPGEPDFRQELARTSYNLGILLKDTSRPGAAEQAFARAIDLLAPLVRRFPRQPAYRQELARCYLNLGPVLRSTQRPRLAEERYGQGRQLLRQLTDEFPRRPDFQYELAVCSNNLGNLLAGLRRHEEAARAYDQALERFQALASDFPRVPVYRKELANTHNSLGALLANTRRFAEARKAWDQARDLLARLARAYPDVTDYEGAEGMVLGNLGWLDLKEQQLEMAREHLRQGIRHLKAALRPNPNNPVHRQSLRSQYGDLAEALIRLDDHAGAARAALALPQVFGDAPADHVRAARLLGECASLAEKDFRLISETRQQLARQYDDRAMELLRGALRHGFRDVGQLERDEKLERLRQRRDFRKLATRPAGQ